MASMYLVTHNGKQHPGVEQVPEAKPLTWWKSVEGDSWRAYIEGEKPNSCNSVEIQLVTSLEGVSHQEVGGFHYIVETDVTPKCEEEFNAWYETEHLPGLARVPGTISAKRYLRLTGSPRYIACYELVSPAVMESSAWLSVRNTPWSSRVRPMFFNTVRVLFTRYP